MNLGSLHAHHRRARSAGRDDSPANLLGLCLHCHGWAHGNVTHARERGWIVPSWGDPRTRPVKIRDGVWWLREDGSREPVAEGAFPLSNVPRDMTQDGDPS